MSECPRPDPQHLSPAALLLPALLTLLAGCASVRYEPVKVDSPMPMAFVNGNHSLIPCGETLKEGSSCLALVRADNWYSDTRVRVKPGQVYCFRVPKGQVWFDADRRNVPPDGESGSFTMNLLSLFRRHDVPWFTLMAGVVSTPVPVPQTMSSEEKLPGQAASALKALQYVNVAAGELLVVEAGVAPQEHSQTQPKWALVMYPNDARGSTGRPGYFYENNSGQIWVEVTREGLPGTCPTKDALKGG